MKRTSGILAAITLVLPLAMALSSCDNGPGTAASTQAALAPHNDVDGMLDEYEAATNAYLKVARKLKGGDVSVTLKVIDESALLKQWTASHQEKWSRMTPAQSKRAAEISAKSAPYLPQ